MIKTIFLYIKSLFTRKNLNNLKFGLGITKAILGNKENEALIARLNMAQDFIDTVNRVIPNSDWHTTKSGSATTDAMANEINGNSLQWQGFTAWIDEDRHGQGNNGIVLGYETKSKKGLSVKLGQSFDKQGKRQIHGNIKLGFR